MIEIDQPTKELLNRMGFIEEENKPGDFKIEIEGGDAHIDFRKENGRRWARVNGQFIKPQEIDKIPILKSFKEEKDKLQSSDVDLLELAKNRTSAQPSSVPREIIDIHGNVEQKTNSKIIPPTGGASMPHAPTSNLLKVIKEDYEADILEVFGDSGSCKTKLMVALAIDGKNEGKKVKFVDTERNLRKKEIEALGDSYQYISDIKALNDFIRNLPKGVDIIIIDSIGYPILTEFSKMTANQKGSSLMQLIAWFGDLKDWAINNNKLVIVTNQPDSDFAKEAGYINRPFGDKARFAAKEIWETKRLDMVKGTTKSAIRTFRSRIKGYGLDIAQIQIDDKGTKITVFS